MGGQDTLFHLEWACGKFVIDNYAHMLSSENKEAVKVFQPFTASYFVIHWNLDLTHAFCASLCCNPLDVLAFMERETGVEPATFSLGS